MNKNEAERAARRTAEVKRETFETKVKVFIDLDGTGRAKIDCPIGFFRHILQTFAKHSLFDIAVSAQGDLEVDQHHLVEDTGIVLGEAFKRALGDKRGIVRAGYFLYPMDETLARAAVDISGRAYLYFDGKLPGIPLVSATNCGKSAPFQTDTIEDFFRAFVNSAGITLHLEILRGRSDHHKIEALFKAAARALRSASEIDARVKGSLPSTKGVL